MLIISSDNERKKMGTEESDDGEKHNEMGKEVHRESSEGAGVGWGGVYYNV